jgi:hypothetical protein
MQSNTSTPSSGNIQGTSLTFFAVALVLLGAFSRLMEHPANFTPLMAISIFGAYTFKSLRLSIVIAISSMILSDLALAIQHNDMNYAWHGTTIVVYACMILGAVIGRLAHNRKPGIVGLAGATLTSSVLFFVVTNFAVWLGGGFYAMTLQGLVECYTMAIPFFKNSLAGDTFYVSVLFGLYALVQKFVPANTKTVEA